MQFQYKVPILKSLPAYIEDNAIEKLLASIDGKKTHWKSALRDRLLVELALKAGMRREELSNLAAGDIHEGFLMVIAGKGNKDRLIPLSDAMAKRLRDFTAGIEPNERVFKLTTGAISNKIRFYAKKAGVDIHTHSLRHKFASDLVKRDVPLPTIQQLMGHENLNTTALYLALSPTSKADAINSLEKPKGKKPGTITVKAAESFLPE